MFEPTIKYKRVNDPSPLPQKTVDSTQEITSIPETATSEPKLVTSEPVPTSKKEKDTENPYAFTFEEEQEAKIKIDPNDKERIIVTLSTGKQFSADRYCPHAGADLSYHGKVSENDYPPEIGPVLMCSIHYWEFALEKGGRGGSGFTTINACPVAEMCTEGNKKLDW
ncbi:uncharacterized protein B0P05DRAFT_537260 [Gilbertella persicaria]|uniref:uncharacterized protein n=1 Tax=Gilbertella persicaria TaxID=101096 RepID=UPI0022205EBD|nr:uncharacterized protein B0P05DRAFT_537260 [Gilbertella persicaria]KAI8082488.1 hypothetical protein B0P05DRAFT_537260 [Gilbertella persicaria]